MSEEKKKIATGRFIQSKSTSYMNNNAYITGIHISRFQIRQHIHIFKFLEIFVTHLNLKAEHSLLIEKLQT